MNDLQMKRISEKYPAVVKCFQIAILQLMQGIGIFQCREWEQKIIMKQSRILGQTPKILLNSKENGRCEIMSIREKCLLPEMLNILPGRITTRLRNPKNSGKWWPQKEELLIETNTLVVLKKHAMITLISYDKKKNMYIQEWYSKCCI